MNFIEEFDFLIIGAGPAGLTASIYASRANLKTAFIDKDAPGGKVVSTAFVENYPGFNNISGPELAMKWFNQAKENGSNHIFGNVINIDTNINGYKYVHLDNGNIYKAKSLLIATGMVNRKLNIPGEMKFFNRGVSYCAICDGSFFKNQKVAVIGSGRSAVEEAIYLSEICSEVIIISNKKQFKADAKIVDSLKKYKNISVLYETNTLEIIGDQSVNSIKIINQNTNKESVIDVNGVFIFIGFIPVLPKFDNNEILGFLEVNNKLETQWEGIYAAGDIIAKSFRQITNATGEGTCAALHACEYITFKKWD